MPVTINDVEIMTDDGKFTEAFKPEMLGEGYKDNKYLSEKSPDLFTLMKSAADSKSALGKKLDNVIQKPPADATDEQKAEYRTLLNKELGSPETIEAFDSESVEGVVRTPEYDAAIKQACLDAGISVLAYAQLRKSMDTYQSGVIKAEKEAETQKFTTESDDFKAAHPGDKLIVGVRTALKALMQFATPEQKDLTDAIRDNKFLENPGDLEAIREKLKLMPSDLTGLENIGNAMKSDTTITNEGNIANETKPEAGTPEAIIANTYTHPSSIKDRQRRGVSY